MAVLNAYIPSMSMSDAPGEAGASLVAGLEKFSTKEEFCGGGRSVAISALFFHS